ncbi:MAG: DUF3500 domain-containing protein [Planctomycetota bacterium]|nr:DUF3500 domain-containing protein [Planctomycetota bacterium]
MKRSTLRSWGPWVMIGVMGITLGADSQDSKPAPAKTVSTEESMQVAASQMADAANAWLASLDKEQQRRTKFLFRDEERRNIHYFPVPRRGLPLKDMNAAQQQLAHALVSTGLSTQGYVKTLTIMSLGQLLREMEPDKPNPFRDSDQYFFTLFGTPGPTGVWGWRLEGFHVSFSFTIVDGKAIAVAPSFLGVHPATVQEGPRKGLRVLSQEEDLGRQLAKSLNDEQKQIAFHDIPVFLEETVGGLTTGNARKIEDVTPTGLPASKMTTEQTGLLWELIQVYAQRHRSEVAESDLARIATAGPEKIHFRWSGSVEPGQGHHYMIHGPTFLIEYDNTQDNANHVHCMWRDLENDFGESLIRRHYELHHRNTRKRPPQ